MRSLSFISNGGIHSDAVFQCATRPIPVPMFEIRTLINAIASNQYEESLRTIRLDSHLHVRW